MERGREGRKEGETERGRGEEWHQNGKEGE